MTGLLPPSRQPSITRETHLNAVGSDPNELELALLNLAVNADGAMSEDWISKSLPLSKSSHCADEPSCCNNPKKHDNQPQIPSADPRGLRQGLCGDNDQKR
jgi:hypothetical protein